MYYVEEETEWRSLEFIRARYLARVSGGFSASATLPNCNKSMPTSAAAGTSHWPEKRVGTGDTSCTRRKRVKTDEDPNFAMNAVILVDFYQKINKTKRCSTQEVAEKKLIVYLKKKGYPEGLRSLQKGLRKMYPWSESPKFIICPDDESDSEDIDIEL